MDTKLLVFAKHLDGGTGTFAEQLTHLKNISGKKIKTKIIALEKPQFRAFRRNNSHIDYFSNKQLLPYQYLLTPSAMIHFIREIIWFRREIEKFQPTVILSIDNHCNILACIEKVIFQKYKDIKLILSIHNNVSAVVFAKLPALGKQVFQRVSRMLFTQASAIVCVSLGVARDAQTFFSLKHQPLVIHVGVDIQEIRRLARISIEEKDKKLFDANTVKILAIGRFAPQKDFITLIDAFFLFNKKVPNSDLFLIGDGPDKAKLIERTSLHNLEKRVHFLGWKQNVYQYIKASDIFALSSIYEGFPYVLLEAAALSKPIVATDTPYGPKEFLGDNDFGMLVNVGDAKAFQRSFLSVLNNKDRIHYQLKINKQIIKYSKTSMLKQYILLISSLK